MNIAWRHLGSRKQRDRLQAWYEKACLGGDGLELARRAIEWVTTLPCRVGVRYDVHGEPFLNDEVMQSISWLTHQDNVEFVEVQTNASMLKKNARTC